MEPRSLDGPHPAITHAYSHPLSIEKQTSYQAVSWEISRWSRRWWPLGQISTPKTRFQCVGGGSLLRPRLVHFISNSRRNILWVLRREVGWLRCRMSRMSFMAPSWPIRILLPCACVGGRSHPSPSRQVAYRPTFKHIIMHLRFIFMHEAGGVSTGRVVTRGRPGACLN